MRFRHLEPQIIFIEKAKKRRKTNEEKTGEYNMLLLLLLQMMMMMKMTKQTITAFLILWPPSLGLQSDSNKMNRLS